jgi:hypothetical protein
VDRSWVAVACVVAACGRLGFDDRAGPRDAPAGAADARRGDGPPDTLLPTDAHVPIAPSFVQHGANAADAVTTVTAQFPGAVTAGDTLVIGIDFGTNPPIPMVDSVVDDLGTAYSLTTPFDGRPGDATRCYFAYGLAPSGGGDAVTVTLSSPSTNFLEVRLHEYADISATSPFDTAVGSDGSDFGSDASVTPVTTTEANELIFAMVIDGTVASGTGFTGRGSDFADVTEDRIATTPGTYDALASPDDAWVSLVGVFRGR